jgi:hypothetical protein
MRMTPMMKSVVQELAIIAPAYTASLGPVKRPNSIVVVLPGPVPNVFDPRITSGTQLSLKTMAAIANGKPRMSALTLMIIVVIGVLVIGIMATTWRFRRSVGRESEQKQR